MFPIKINKNSLFKIDLLKRKNLQVRFGNKLSLHFHLLDFFIKNEGEIEFLEILF
jgi:hypothetical protein